MISGGKGVFGGLRAIIPIQDEALLFECLDLGGGKLALGAAVGAGGSHIDKPGPGDRAINPFAAVVMAGGCRADVVPAGNLGA